MPCCLQARDTVRNKIVALVLGTDMKQHFGTCGAFGSGVLSPLLVAVAAVPPPPIRPPQPAAPSQPAPPPPEGAFGIKVLAPLHAAAIAAAASPPSDPAGATVVLGDDEDDDGSCRPDHEDGEDGDDVSSVLRGLQMDDEAQLLTWKVWEGGEGDGVGKCARGRWRREQGGAGGRCSYLC